MFLNVGVGGGVNYLPKHYTVEINLGIFKIHFFKKLFFIFKFK